MMACSPWAVRLWLPSPAPVFTALSIPCRQGTARAPVGRADITLRGYCYRIRRREWRRRHDGVAAFCQRIEHVRRKARLDIDFVGLPLMMQARRADRLVDRQMKVDRIHDDLEHRADDAAAAGRAGDEKRLAVLEHDGWSHRGERP